jgi:hypothetical protein
MAKHLGILGLGLWLAMAFALTDGTTDFVSYWVRTDWKDGETRWIRVFHMRWGRKRGD